MLINFFYTLKTAGVPVSIKELLVLLEAMQQHLAFGSIDDFYVLARTCLVKDEKYFDRFDQAFGRYFKDMQTVDDIISAIIPDEWLRQEFEKHLTEEEKKQIQSLGGLDGSVLAVHHPLDTAAITLKGCVLAEKARTSVLPRYGRNVSSKIWMTRLSWVRAISRWR